MFLKSFYLQSFRSFKKKNFKFSPDTTLIVGPNAVGKTNVLEVIYLLATGKSFRASKESEMIRYGEEMARVKGVINDGASLGLETKFEPVRLNRTLSNLSPSQTNLSLEIILTTGEVQGKKTARKLYKVNGVGKRWRDFAGILKCVLFRPEDIDLILGPPSMRRNYLDSVLEQSDWQYRVCNLAYKKGLRQRNKLLDRIREGEAKRAQLTFWNQLLIKNGQIITQKREEMIEFFNQQLSKEKHDKNIHMQVFVNYDKSTITEERLEKYAQAELALGRTLVGPHRDDIVILKIPSREWLSSGRKNKKIKRKLALYGSRGEQRMAVLYLKLAELEFMSQKTGQQPILLLDDVLSELDKKNRTLVLKIIDGRQTIITSTEKEKDLFSFTPEVAVLVLEK